MRLATFEFDYKKRRVDVGDRCDNERVYNSNDFGKRIKVGNEWIDVEEEASKKKGVVENSNVEDRRDVDEVDNGNGYRNNEEGPLSLSADGLRDIRDLTSSLHDLVINMDETRDNGTLSSDKMRKKKDSQESLRKETYETRPGKEDDSTLRLESPLSFSNKHSVNRRNGNSLTNLHSKPLTKSKDSSESKIANEPHCNTPKTGKRTNDRIARAKRTNLCKIGNFTRNRSNEGSSNEQEHKNTGDLSVDRLSQSTDRMSESSDNNIETSDSFVNIQFAQHSRRGNESNTSSQSIQSSDSFENTRFTRDFESETRLQDKKSNDGVVRRETGRSAVARKAETAESRRSIASTNYRQIKQPNDYNFSRTSRPSLIPVQNNGQTRNSVKGVELSRIPITDVVKLREKKNVAGTTPTSHIRNDLRAARRSALENVRKCSSTDELREDQEPNIAKTKRFSLYYTPQPSRKNYETDNKSVRTISRTPNNTSNRPTSWKTPEPSKNMNDDISRIIGQQKDSFRNRRSVVETSTVASRNKTSRQTVHTRNSNLPPGRTK